MYNLISYGPEWRSQAKDDQINFVIKDGYIYRLCNVAGSTFLVPSTDKQVSEIHKSGIVEDLNYEIENTWPKIPANIMRFTLDYFAAIFEDRRCEAAVLLYYNQESKKWAVLVPVQYDCSLAAVSYAIPGGKEIPEITKDKEMNEQYQQTVEEAEGLENEGYYLVGTIHSHCDFDAFHSGVDDKDEFQFDGLHITIGHVDRVDSPAKDGSEPSYAARIIVNGTEIKKEIKDVACIGSSKKVKIAAELMDRHHKRSIVTSAAGFRQWSGGFGHTSFDKDDGKESSWWNKSPAENRWDDHEAWINNRDKATWEDLRDESEDIDEDDALDMLIPAEDVVVLHKGKKKFVIDSDSYEVHGKALRKLGYK